MVFIREFYDKEHCWQFEIRKRNFHQDLELSNLTLDAVAQLKISDFEFSYIPSSDLKQAKEIKQFINRHEWLGKMPNRPTHRFVAKYNGELAGVVVMATPNSFSHLLGKENLSKEKLISRGACISWAPLNLASWLIMKSINWMIQNTQFRFFTAYADTEAKELGTIYQACNFIYLGKNSGTRFEFFDDQNPRRGWVSDRIFRKVGQYKKYAKEAEILWNGNWSSGCKMHWDNVPADVQSILRNASKDYQNRCQKRKVSPKHKYVYIKGRSKKETKSLINCFLNNNPKFKPLDADGRPGIFYPKVRGQ